MIAKTLKHNQTWCLNNAFKQFHLNKSDPCELFHPCQLLSALPCMHVLMLNHVSPLAKDFTTDITGEGVFS